MGIMDSLAQVTAQALAASLSEVQRERGTALIVAKTIKPDADITDLMILANYVVTGFDLIPEPKDDPYPYPSGEVTVLGPQIFASTTGPAENAVISWRGENFIPQREPVDEGYHVELGSHRFTQSQWEAIRGYCTGSIVATTTDQPSVTDEHPDDPGPEEPSGDLPDLDPAASAPMAGLHWRGQRGGRSG